MNLLKTIKFQNRKFAIDYFKMIGKYFQRIIKKWLFISSIFYFYYFFLSNLWEIIKILKIYLISLVWKIISTLKSMEKKPYKFTTKNLWNKLWSRIVKILQMENIINFKINLSVEGYKKVWRAHRIKVLTEGLNQNLKLP